MQLFIDGLQYLIQCLSQQYRKLCFGGVTDPQFLGNEWGWKVGHGFVGKAIMISGAAQRNEKSLGAQLPPPSFPPSPPSHLSPHSILPILTGVRGVPPGIFFKIVDAC
jgi:hypothetical protein